MTLLLLISPSPTCPASQLRLLVIRFVVSKCVEHRICSKCRVDARVATLVVFPALSRIGLHLNFWFIGFGNSRRPSHSQQMGHAHSEHDEQYGDYKKYRADV